MKFYKKKRILTYFVLVSFLFSNVNIAFAEPFRQPNSSPYDVDVDKGNIYDIISEKDVISINAEIPICPVGMVYVGAPGNFCVDMYEATCDLDGDGTCTDEEFYPVDLNGDSDTADSVLMGYQYITESGRNKIYGAGASISSSLGFYRAYSMPNRKPWTNITQAQAQAACMASGKHLITNYEYYLASLGTPDYLASDPGNDSEPCNIFSSSKPASATYASGNYLAGSGNFSSNVTLTGSANSCVSSAGAYDMVGNVWEMTSDNAYWNGANVYYKGNIYSDANSYVNGVNLDGLPNSFSSASQARYNNDRFFNGGGNGSLGSLDIYGTSASDGRNSSMIVRGGDFESSSDAGLYSASFDYSPSYTGFNIGFRCASAPLKSQAPANHVHDQYLQKYGITRMEENTKLEFRNSDDSVAMLTIDEPSGKWGIGTGVPENYDEAMTVVGGNICVDVNSDGTCDWTSAAQGFWTLNDDGDIYRNTGNVGIGKTSPSQKLDVAGNIAVSGTVDGVNIAEEEVRLANTSGTNTGDNATNTQYSGLIGDVMADSLHRHSELSASDGDPNPALKVDAIGNVGIGKTSPSQKLDVAGNINFNTNGDNTLISNYKGANSDGNNIFIGGGGQSSIGEVGATYKGSNNTGIGMHSLYSNTTGYYNTGIGMQSLYSNTTGYYNTGIGISSLRSNTTGYSNTGIGYQAGRYIANGTSSNQTSSNSVYLGYNTKALASGDTNEIVIGYEATGLGNNSVNLGNDDITLTALHGNIELDNNDWLRAKDYAGTGVVNMFKVNEDNEIDVGGTLNIGTLSLVEDSGAVTLVNMPVSSTPTAGDEMSYAFSLDSNVIAKVYAEADGSGGIQNKRFNVNGDAHITGNLQVDGNFNLDLTSGSSDTFVVGSETIDTNISEGLQILTNTGNAGLAIKSATSPHWSIYQDDTTDDLRFWNADNRMTITDDGNIGIGKITPIEKLEVDGKIKASLFLENNPSAVTNHGGTPTYCYDEVGATSQLGDSDSDCTTSAPADCPAGFVSVPGNKRYGTDGGFCVMKYEAKYVGGVATSQTSGNPWVSITQTNAIAECRALGDGYHLITNAEWMTIARNIEQVSDNWYGGVVGTNFLFSGHNDNSSASLAASTDGDFYYGTGDSASTCDGVYTNFSVSDDTISGRACVGQKRTMTLSNGEVIWDLSGNVWEWNADVIVGNSNSAFGQSTGWKEFTSLSNYTVMSYASLRPSNSSWDATKSVGRIYVDSDNAYPSGDVHAFIRGGAWIDGSYAGVFTLYLNYSPSNSASRIGFRCAR